MTTDNPPSVEEVLKPFATTTHPWGDYQAAAQALAFLQANRERWILALAEAILERPHDTDIGRALREIAAFLGRPS